MAALLILFAIALLPTYASAAAATDFLSATLSKAGTEPGDLPYRYLIPAGYDAAKSYPLIVFLHGSGERGNDNVAQLNNRASGALQLVSAENQAAYPCFMLAPQASAGAGDGDDGWNLDSLGQVMRVIEKMQKQYSIDRNRIYVTGVSMGGAATWAIVVQYPTVFAAAVPMSGWGAGSYARIVGLPLWAFHAVDDDQVPVILTDKAVDAVRALGGKVLYTRYASGGHGIWPTAYATPELLPWLMAQRRSVVKEAAVGSTAPTGK